MLVSAHGAGAAPWVLPVRGGNTPHRSQESLARLWNEWVRIMRAQEQRAAADRGIMPDSWDYSRRRPEGALSGAQQPILTWLVCGLCVLLTVAHHTSAGMTGTLWFQIGQFGVLPAEDIWEGHYAALFTSVFIHGNPSSLLNTVVHLGFNMLWFLRLGSLLEATIHPLFWALFFIASAVVASGAELAVMGQTGVGASGVVYALFGLLWAGRMQFPAWRAVATRETFNLFVGWGLFCLFATWMGALRIANAAHGGGFLFGLATGWLFVEKRHRLAGAAALAGLIALTLLSVTWLPWSAAWTEWRGDQALARGQPAAAIDWYRRSIRVGANEPLTWGKIAEVERMRNNPAGVEAAMREMERALQRTQRGPEGPDNPNRPPAPPDQEP